MITLKLTHYSYEQMVLLETKLNEAYVSLLSYRCSEQDCNMCPKNQVCIDLSSAVHYIRKKTATLEKSDADPPSNCF